MAYLSDNTHDEDIQHQARQGLGTGRLVFLGLVVALAVVALLILVLNSGWLAGS